MWLTDPKTNQKSVTLTLTVVSVLCVIVVGGLQVAGKTTSVSVFPEFMYSSLALYLGRRVNINNKVYGTNPSDEGKN